MKNKHTPILKQVVNIVLMSATVVHLSPLALDLKEHVAEVQNVVDPVVLVFDMSSLWKQRSKKRKPPPKKRK
jgi:hypothetical protein